MKKCILPKNWIIVSSKSHPDRIYYFNVKTNKSTWEEPTLEQVNDKSSEHIRKRHKNYDEEEECSRARTPEYHSAENNISNQQLLNNRKSSKIVTKAEKKKSNETNRTSAQDRMQNLRGSLNHEIQKHKEDNLSVIIKKPSEKSCKTLPVSCLKGNDTPQMKALREKLLQRKLEKPAIRNKSSIRNQEHNLTLPSLRKSSERTENNETNVSSLKRLHSELQAEESDNIISSSRETSSVFSGYSKTMISLDQNDNRTTFTPQMRILYEKIQRNSNTFVLDKKAKGNLKGKQDLKFAKPTLVKTTGRQEKNTPSRRNADWNKHDVKQKRNYQTNKAINNLAQDRMQKLRKSLEHEIQKLEGDCSIITEIPSEKLDMTFSSSCKSENIESTSVHKNSEIRLKRLHNKVLKETVYKRNVTISNNELSIQPNDSNVNNMTKEKLMEQATQEVLYEEMDWEPMKDEEITLEVEDIRAQLNNENCTNVSNCLFEGNSALTQPLESQEKGPLYIVIDTNVFLSNLEIIEEARDATFKTYPRPFIVIPWTVIRELDYLKSDKSRSGTLRTKARKAISFINEHFASKHPRIIGQTREQAVMNKDNFSIDCPDDEILQCCLQIKNLKKDVVLLSYDKNLCTKAMIYCVTILGRNDPLEQLDNLNISNKIMNPLSNDGQHSLLSEELRFSDELFEDAKLIMKDLFSAIITKQMAEIFGPEWETYVIIKPPWTVVTALKCIVKHWIAALNESFQQQTEPIARELLECFEHLPVGGRKLQNVENILEKCSDLIQTINTDKHYEHMLQSFNAIAELKKKCTQCITDMKRKQLHDRIGTAKDAQEEEQRAEKVLQCFKQIYSYVRDFCGSAANVTGKVFPLNYNPINPPLSYSTVKRLQPDISKKITDLSHSLNRLLVQAENNSIKYQALIIIQQDLNAFLAYIETLTMDVELLDIFYCVTLKEEVLKIGLRQLQELSTHYRALYLTTCT